MAYQSKTYSLSDGVVAAIEAARANGETPNRFLRRVLGLDSHNKEKRHHTDFCNLPRNHSGVCRQQLRM